MAALATGGALPDGCPLPELPGQRKSGMKVVVIPLARRTLGAVSEGQALAIHHSGDAGVRFAVEIVVKSGA